MFLGHLSAILFREPTAHRILPKISVRTNIDDPAASPALWRTQFDLTETGVARELEISVGTVKSHHARGIARLREIFAEGDLR
jgi:hypothetical protein